MRARTSAIIAAAIGLILATTGARAESPKPVGDEATQKQNQHMACGKKCGFDKECYQKCLAEYDNPKTKK